MVWNVPPPPCVTQMLGYCAPQRPRPPGPGGPGANQWIMTSFRNDSRPAIQSTAVARGLVAPVKTPRPLTIVRPPCGAWSSAFGSPTPANASRPIRQIDPGRGGMERDQHGVRLQRERVADDVGAGREVQDALAVDRRLQRLRVVGLAVARHAERPHVDPLLHRRQRGQRRRQRRRRRRQRLGVVRLLDPAGAVARRGRTARG